tara:strand:- start:70545 stop:71711 length:1167 start_codon:yes stop_codon:yes gene_type:complete
MSETVDSATAGTPQLCQTPLGDFPLQRYPARRKELLQAWCGADLLLLEAVAQMRPRPTSALVVNDEHGALCTALSASGIATTLWTDSALAARATALNTANNSVPAVDVVWSTERPPAAPDIVLLRVPKQKALLRQQLATLAGLLPAGAPLLAAAMDKHTPKGLNEELRHWIGSPHREHGQHKAHLWRAQRAAEPVSAAPEPGNDYPSDALGIPLYALPNVFSREGLDIGTRFLLDQLPTLRPVSCAVDLACGNGVIGLAALQAGLATTVWFCDESAQAIASARVNAGRLLASTADQQTRFLHGDGLLAWTAEAPELVLCNPPFHAQHTVDDFVGRRLILQAAQVLAPGGALCLVANRHLDYRSVLQTGFKQWRVLAENRKFRVYLAER